jgi:hypothetical protein
MKAHLEVNIHCFVHKLLEIIMQFDGVWERKQLCQQLKHQIFGIDQAVFLPK